MNYDEHDLNSVALCAWKEARGEGPEGMRAVMHVIRNRVGTPGFARDVHDVVYGRNQFTSMSVPTDPEFNLEPSPGDPQWLFCSNNAEAVLNGDDADPTNGAHYYANEKTMTSGWYFRNIVENPQHPVVAVIGHQTFRK